MLDTENATQTTLVLRRTFDAPPARVFAAWTQPEVLAQWFMPEDKTMPECAMDARVGGAYRITFKSPGDDVVTMFGTIVEYRPASRLAMTFTWEEDEKELEHEMLLALDFHDAGGKTDFVLTHSKFRDADQRDRHDGGWSHFLDKIAVVVEAK